MRPMRLRRSMVGLALAGMALAGCGSSKSSTKATTPATTVPATTTTMDPAAAKAAIAANWNKLFDGSNPDLNSRITFVENSAKFGAIFKKAQQQAGASASAVSTRVNNVELLDTAGCNDALAEALPCARVTFDVIISGKTDPPALPNYKGYAVLDNSVWKASSQTVCALTALEQVSCPA